MIFHVYCELTTYFVCLLVNYIFFRQSPQLYSSHVRPYQRKGRVVDEATFARAFRQP